MSTPRSSSSPSSSSTYNITCSYPTICEDFCPVLITALKIAVCMALIGGILVHAAHQWPEVGPLKMFKAISPTVATWTIIISGIVLFALYTASDSQKEEFQGGAPRHKSSSIRSPTTPFRPSRIQRSANWASALPRRLEDYSDSQILSLSMDELKRMQLDKIEYLYTRLQKMTELTKPAEIPTSYNAIHCLRQLLSISEQLTLQLPAGPFLSLLPFGLARALIMHVVATPAKQTTYLPHLLPIFTPGSLANKRTQQLLANLVPLTLNQLRPMLSPAQLALAPPPAPQGGAPPSFSSLSSTPQ